MKYTTLLFDADETLLYFKRAEREAITATLFHFGIVCSEEIISSYSEINDSLWKQLELGLTTKEKLKTERFERLCLRYGFDILATDMASRYINELSKQAYTIEGAEKLCSMLYEKGFKMYIITNGIKSVQTSRMSRSSIGEYFIRSFISEDVGYEKPNREFFESVKKEIEDFDIEKTLVIGDSLSSDIKGGINAGIDTCWYNPSRKSRPDGMNITYEVSSLEDILKILEV